MSIFNVLKIHDEEKNDIKVIYKNGHLCIPDEYIYFVVTNIMFASMYGFRMCLEIHIIKKCYTPL